MIEDNFSQECGASIHTILVDCEECVSLSTDIDVASNSSSDSESWDLLTDSHSEYWDMVSEIPDSKSVESFDVLTFSYKDALMMEQEPSSKANLLPAKKKTFKTSVATVNTDISPACNQEVEIEEQFDSFFALNGYKGARGGRVSTMFNTHQKQSKRAYQKRNRIERRHDKRSARRLRKQMSGQF
jgi:hypothetical protein